MSSFHHTYATQLSAFAFFFTECAPLFSIPLLSLSTCNLLHAAAVQRELASHRTVSICFASSVSLSDSALQTNK